MNKLALAVALLIAGPATSLATDKGASGDPATKHGYAERLYADYAADNDTGVGIAVTTIATGSMKTLSGMTIQRVVGAPAHHVEADDGALRVSGTHFAPFDANKVNYAELDGLVDAFDGVGYPIADGAYRLLDVDVAIGNESKRHRAVEFCWPAQQHCVVFDPTIEFLDAIVAGHRTRKADGWAPRVVYGSPSVADAVPPEGCGLASRPYATSRSTWWGRYKIEYYNLLGQTIIRKQMGAQEIGIRCNASCNVSPYATSEGSSAQTFGGGTAYSVDCGNAAGWGSTGNTAKAEAETKCSHRLTFGARADASVSNFGSLAVDVQWNTQGSIDTRGGQMIDSCGYY